METTGFLPKQRTRKAATKQLVNKLCAQLAPQLCIGFRVVVGSASPDGHLLLKSERLKPLKSARHIMRLLLDATRISYLGSKVRRCQRVTLVCQRS